jgi:ABC-type sugar transport system ATPase subunit
LTVDVSRIKAGDEIDIGIRPEDLGVSASKVGIPMSVDVVEHIGATVILHGSVLGNSNFCAVVPSDSTIKPGETVNLVFDSSKCHAFNSSGQALKKTNKKI